MVIAIDGPAGAGKSTVARAAADVRMALVRKQQEILRAGDWVAEGRDVGTVVCPQAEVKVFLTASPEVRARRRAEELGADYETVYAQQVERDERDARHEHS